MTNSLKNVVADISSTVSNTIFGQDATITHIVGALLIGGHVLLEGPPGVAKTLVAKTFAQSIGVNFQRIQFTPDLMPSDVTGVNIFDPKEGAFRLVQGPLFSDVVLADEINRTPPKTQSALLQAMEERTISIDGTQHNLGPFFFVIATQNPIEHEGTFPLPEAQLDRFLFKLTMTYPGENFEKRMVAQQSAPGAGEGTMPHDSASAVVSQEALTEARHSLRTIGFDTSIGDYMHRIIQATREHPDILLGASPRAAVHLALGAKFRAGLSGRSYLIPDDVQEAAPLVLCHRLTLHPEYDAPDAGHTLLDDIIQRVPVPQ